MTQQYEKKKSSQKIDEISINIDELTLNIDENNNKNRWDSNENQ